MGSAAPSRDAGEGRPPRCRLGVTQCRVPLRGTYDATGPLSSLGPDAALPSRRAVGTAGRCRSRRSQL
jgi:hypothetical protein